MTWRRVPPVYSPIGIDTLWAACTAAVGVARPRPAVLVELLAASFAATRVLLTDSGTSALTLALRGVVRRGEVVAFPGYACIDIVTAALGAEVKMLLYDVEPATLSPDLDSVRDCLARGARAVVVAPLFGYPIDMNALMTLAAEHGTPVIEDAAQSAGATLDGRRVGSFSDVAVLSFGRGKGVTGGGGGALLLRGSGANSTTDAVAGLLGASGRGFKAVPGLVGTWLLARPALYSIPASLPMLQLGEMVFHAPRPPRAMATASIAAARRSLARDPAELATRRAHAHVFHTACRDAGGPTPVTVRDGAQPGFLRFAVILPSPSTRAAEHLGVVRAYPITVGEHPETRRVLSGKQADLPGARDLRDRLVTLPTHSRMTHADVTRLQAWLVAIAGARAPRNGRRAP